MKTHEPRDANPFRNLKRLAAACAGTVLAVAGVSYHVPTRFWPIEAAQAQAAVTTTGVAPVVKPDKLTNADLVKRGEYLTRAGDCAACHTADKSRPFAGGLPITTPFGTIYTPNITSDPDTGIGRWTDADF
ncbi:MAG: cytochrome c, partial [Caballeronia sp.]